MTTITNSTGHFTIEKIVTPASPIQLGPDRADERAGQHEREQHDRDDHRHHQRHQDLHRPELVEGAVLLDVVDLV